tara:strand:+ start:1243 stop:2646 length:1404 start_codon:yes stop_codon:yes gene_type:complete
MSKPAIATLNSTSDPSFNINVQGGGEYMLTIYLFNSDGGFRILRNTMFGELTLESLYESPFSFGSLQVVDDFSQSVTYPGAYLDEIRGRLEFNFTGAGEEMLYIKVEEILNKKENRKITTVNNFYSINSRDHIIKDNQRFLILYFSDILYNHLSNKKITWSTNNLLDKNTSQLSSGDRQVLTGDAIKNLLKTFVNKDCISSKWDSGISRTEHILYSDYTALDALNSLMSGYVSSNKDMGIIKYINGKFQLLSLKDIFSNVKNNISLAYEITTGEVKRDYSNEESNILFPIGTNFVNIELSEVKFDLKNPLNSNTSITDHRLINYDIGSKTYKLNDSNGSINNLTEEYKDYSKNFPDSKSKIADIQKGKIYKNAKNIIMDYSSSYNEFLGKTTLQNKTLMDSDKISFVSPGNLNVQACNFVGIKLDFAEKNKFIKETNGFWFVTKNVTTLTPTQAVSNITAAKIFKIK